MLTQLKSYSNKEFRIVIRRLASSYMQFTLVMKKNLENRNKIKKKISWVMLEIFLALSPSKAIKWDLTRAIALSSYHFKAYNNYYYFLKKIPSIAGLPTPHCESI